MGARDTREGAAVASILLVEDDRTIQMALEFALTRAGYEVSVTSDGEAGISAARACDPDLILLDVLLPRRSGLEVARALRADGSDTPIVMLTALDREVDKVAGLDAGADDYVTKPFSTAELLARVRAQLRRVRTRKEPPRFIDTGALHIDADATRVLVAGKPLCLRSKEYALLVALASREGSLCTRQWLSECVWGETFLSTSRTLDTHVRRLRRAIDSDTWSYIHTERGMGYRFEAKRKDGTNPDADAGDRSA
jgi:DNA-binding response OmpR family regulator